MRAGTSPSVACGAEVIAARPVLDDLPVADAEHVDVLDRERPSGRREPGDLSDLAAAGLPSDDDEVAPGRGGVRRSARAGLARGSAREPGGGFLVVVLAPARSMLRSMPAAQVHRRAHADTVTLVVSWALGAAVLPAPGFLRGQRSIRGARDGRPWSGLRGLDVSRIADAGVAGASHRGRAVADTQLREDVRDVVADGLLAEVQPDCDRVVCL